MNRDCLSEFQAEIHSLWYSILEQPFVSGNPNVKESKWQSRLLTLFCEGLCELLVTLQQQHFAASDDLHEHLRRHSLWKDTVKMEYSKMRSESSECTWNGQAMLIHLESYLEECTQEVWERNLMNLDMHIACWNVNILKPMEMILMVLTEQSEEDDQMNTAGEPVILIPETLREWEPTLKERGGFWEWQSGNYPPKIW